MPRKVLPWFRFYSETPRDRKIRRLTMTQRWLWVCILSAAGESPQRGRLLIADGVAMTAAELADYADVRRQDVRPAIDLMAKLGMVEMKAGVLTVCNWDARQFESDNVTARTQRHRERSKERSKERSDDVPSNVRRNAPETETETEHVELNKRGNRHLPINPTEARCATHKNILEDPGPCRGCMKARENAERAEDQIKTEAAETRRLCPDCDETGFQLHPTTGLPTSRCNHRRTA